MCNVDKEARDLILANVTHVIFKIIINETLDFSLRKVALINLVPQLLLAENKRKILKNNVSFL